MFCLLYWLLRALQRYIFLKKDLAGFKNVCTFAPDFERETRSASSVGLERLLDRQEVTSSNLVQITRKGAPFRALFLLCRP